MFEAPDPVTLAIRPKCRESMAFAIVTLAHPPLTSRLNQTRFVEHRRNINRTKGLQQMDLEPITKTLKINHRGSLLKRSHERRIF
jgi:hypothetical protein